MAELLIVIAIIGALIAILLPALSAARRSAATVKCLSALRQIGTAFQMYAQDNHRYLPVVRWYPVTGQVQAESTGVGANAKERVWEDMLSKYLLKQNTYGDYTIYAAHQSNSVFWGCPAFNTDTFDPTGATDRKYSMSYGMSMYAIGPYRSIPTLTIGVPAFITATGNNGAWVTPGGGFPAGYYGTGGVGQWYKLEEWGRHSQDKGIVADASGLDIVCSTTWDRAAESQSLTTVFTEPASMGLDYPRPAPPNGSFISVDIMRHASPTGDKRKLLASTGTNMLFVDGHAQGVTARAAWIACYGGGTNSTKTSVPGL